MTQTMRWFGPADPVKLREIRQSGCTGVVTALHEIPPGQLWDLDSIRARRKMIDREGLEWKVVESLPVHEEIKKGGPEREGLIELYKQSVRHLTGEGINVITYNFMPLLDWVRTDLAVNLEDGSKALRFDMVDFAVFDLFLLKRPGAELDYPEKLILEANKRYESMQDTARVKLYRSALMGLPGTTRSFTPEEILDSLEGYEGIGPEDYRSNLIFFLKEIVPVAEDCGAVLAIHPDDPPFPLLGLPRVVSTEKDIELLAAAVPSTANGLCFCTGSFGAIAQNDLPSMVEKFADRIQFLHLRNVRKDGMDSFQEASHLEGDTDMAAVVNRVLRIMQDRKKSIPMRPDHGHQMLEDLHRNFYPGYSLIGRLKGLAEIRGLEYGLIQQMVQQLS